MFIETFEAILTVFFVGVAIGVFFWLRYDVKKHEKEVQKLQDKISHQGFIESYNSKSR